MMSRLRFLPLFALVLAGAAVFADAPAKMESATVQKVKRATLYLQVRVPGGAVYEGTGFFVDEPGLLVTNAHVLGMLEPNSRKPLQVDVTVNSGEANSKTYRGVVLGADRGTDLAVLRVQGKDLPEPLKLGLARNLTELQDVYIFGFPFGKQLGKNITISKSSVSSLRKSGSAVNKIQVNGGMNPGNSGGPVTDAEGNVVGVAVSAVRNSSVHFAIPSEHVRYFLDGRPEFTTREAAYKDGDKIKLPVLVKLNDPLGRMKKVAVEVWVGPAGPPRGASLKEPKALPGDAAKQVVTLNYDKKGTARGEITLDPLSDPKKVYWLRPVLTNARDETRWISAKGERLHMLLERKPITLKYQPAPGKQLFTSLTSNAALRLRDRDGEEHSIRSNMKVILRELSAKDAPEGGGGRFLVRFRSIAAGIFIDNQLVKGDAETNEIFQNAIKLALNVELDGDGNITLAKQDMGQVSRQTRDTVSDFGDQVVQSLKVMTAPLSGDALKPLQTWKTQRLLEVGPLGIAMPVQADIRYTYLGVREQLGQTQAVLSMRGTLRGQRGDGSGAAGTVDGTLMISPKDGQVVAGVATLRVDVDLPFRRQTVKANGELVVNFNRGEKDPTPPPAKKK